MTGKRRKIIKVLPLQVSGERAGQRDRRKKLLPLELLIKINMAKKKKIKEVLYFPLVSISTYIRSYKSIDLMS